MRVVFRPPTSEDIEALALTMREADRIECECASGRGPKQVLVEGVAQSDWSYAALVDGETVCIFGLAEIETGSPLDSCAAPWMLSATGIERHARALIECAPYFVAEMQSRYQLLQNTVLADNRAAIRFIRWCGFSLGESVEIGGKSFLRFEASV